MMAEQPVKLASAAFAIRAAAAGAALLCAAPAAAQDAASPPDLSGFWAPDFSDAPRDAQLLAKLPGETVMVEDTGIIEFPANEFGGLDIKPDALAKARQWKPTDEMTLDRVCAAPSMIYSIQGPFPFEIHQTPGLIVFQHEYFDQVRLVFMDGRDHPPADAPHSKVGHSIGHWEGDELVIDTTHFVPSTITNNGLDHSANIHMIERYSLGDDGETLVATQWFEDPDVLNNNGARYIQWQKQPGNHVYPYDCDPSFALEYQQLEPAPLPDE